LIGHWLKQCTENHARCNASIPEPWAPTRLLDIGTAEDDDIRLVERDESLFGKQPYATLSHCWGNGMHKRTTRESLAHNLVRIALLELSKTFRHAIEVARFFNLRYLWIDSLCIIQDSKSDWKHESDLMSKVYRHCFINIAATGASDGTKGCYWERDPVTIPPTEVSIQWSNSLQSNSMVYHVVPEPHIWARKLIDQPLNQRGWVLQERILSPRVLHFGHEQLFWECREFVACESYHRGLPTSLRTNTLIDIKSLQLGDERQDKRWPAKYILGDPPGKTSIARLWNAMTKLFRPIIVHEVTLNTTLKKASVFQDWDAVVELYTLGALTFPIDKLEALAGLAKSIADVEPGEPGDGYLAGLWQSSLPAYLLWTTEVAGVIRGSGRKSEKMIPARYTHLYVAPTWSWASISGKISLAWCQHNYDPKDYLAELEHAEVRPESYRFGGLLSGFLKLSAPIASVLWKAADDPSLICPSAGRITHISPGHFERHMSISTPPDNSTDPEILFDTMDNATEELTLIPIVGITKRSAHENEAVIGIVLKQSADGQDFVRIGFFYTMRPQVRRILRNMPRQSITII
jgi:hypothetical protein